MEVGITVNDTEGIFARTRLMLGDSATEALRRTRVAIFGLGGVGGWCAESLVRTGVGHMAIVDFDRICESNVNRQLIATTATIGRPKAETLAGRLREINPAIDLDVRPVRYDATTAATFDLASFDYVIDAIDSLDCKALLIRNALDIPSLTLFSSMGAALKSDPSLIRRDSFGAISGDRLARALRQRLRKSGGIPARDFACVWSPERRENIGACNGIPRANGTVAHATAIFGFTLAGLVVADIERRVGNPDGVAIGGLHLAATPASAMALAAR